MSYYPAQQLRLYRNFKAIDATDYFETIRYYERYEDAIYRLDFEAYFDCVARYTEALFQIEEYGKHLVMVDHLLELIIRHNVATHEGQDIYVFSLFRKGCSLYQQKEYAHAEHILRETVKIAPWEQQPIKLLKRTLLRQTPFWVRQVRNIAAIGVLSAIAVRMITYLAVQPYFPDYINVADASYYVFLGGGLGTWFIGEMAHHLTSLYTNRQFVKSVLKKKLDK